MQWTNGGMTADETNGMYFIAVLIFVAGFILGAWLW